MRVKDIGVRYVEPIQTDADASTAIGIGSTLGIGKLRHRGQPTLAAENVVKAKSY